MNNLEVINLSNDINNNYKRDVFEIVKKENPDSILANLSEIIVYKYFDIAIKSKKIYFFILRFNNSLLGYAILANKPKYLISEFKTLKLEIFKDLLINKKFYTLINIILSFLKIDIFFLKKEDSKLFKESLNLNLIAIKKEYQSKGYGKIFIDKILEEIKKYEKFTNICCETYSDRAEVFYKNKLNFFNLGKKIRLKKHLKILIKFNNT